MFAAKKIRTLLSATNIVSLRPGNASFTLKENTHTVLTFPHYMMPQNNSHSTTSKRKAPSSPQQGSGESTKKVKSANDSTDPINIPDPNSQIAEDNGIILRAFYGPEMSNERAVAYKEGKLPRPIELLNSALAGTRSDREGIKIKDAVVHWFRSDLRTRDNRALHAASEKAKERNVPLIAMYIVSPQDFEAHLVSPPRVDFVLRTLQILKADLAKLDIPLYIETFAKRKEIPGKVLALLKKWGANHLYANMEIEVDELRRDENLVRQCLEDGIAVEVLPDTCVVHPGELVTGSGNQYSVFTPWFRSWVAHIHSHPELLKLSEAPARNSADARQKYSDLFENTIPVAPHNKRLNDEEKKRFQSLWPAGEHEAQKRLKSFTDQRIGDYEAHRNFPAEDATSSLSVDFSSGTLSARTAVRIAQDHNRTKRLDGGDTGIQSWIREVAWRDFYRHVLAHWPYICMYKPFKPEYAFVEWEYDQEKFKAWCEGKTGYPIVDAAMRQLNHSGWMHNRCRMIAASFLAKHLLIDWRMGERYFMEHLIDGDFSSNNGGWGFSSSAGVDPQPYFRIFNPLLQSEKFDEDGDYIRRWVPELSGIAGKAIHDPYDRGKGPEAKRNGYPKRIVDHKQSRDRCLARYKEVVGRVTEP